MLKELIAIGMATTLMTAPPQNTNDGTYYQDVNITETYEYETNEVNSVDDLVVGNIYKTTIYKSDIVANQTNYLVNSYMIYMPNFEFKVEVDSYTRAYTFMLRKNINNFVYIYAYGQNINANIFNLDYTYLPNELTVYFVYYYDGTYTFTEQYINNVSASDYLGEKTITAEPVETEGLYNLAYHFLYSRIYTNTELQGMETTLFGTTINMNMWLSHTTAIVIICLLLVVLIKFVIWLFKIVSGGMLWQ